MNRTKLFAGRSQYAFLLVAGLLSLASFTAKAHAADYLNLPVVKPVVSCDQLAKADLTNAVGTAVTVTSASATDTPKGQFCKITGTIASAVMFEVDLPADHWTQRYAQGGCGAYCGNVRVGLSNTGSCMPALNGEFALASDDMGHQGGMNAPGGDSAFGADPDKRIDFAYRANHETTLVAKALIKSFYGQPQKYAYFVGCSDGGREALAEAERYPNDFDGISAGAPVAIVAIHNSFFHGWESAANKRSDGSSILLRGRVSILHDAVLAHCSTLSGVQDGLLEDPLACKFDPSWVQCAAGATDTSKCLTAEETGVAQKLYDGPHDDAGDYFEPAGYPMGSELSWNMPNAARTAQNGPGGGMTTGSLKYLLLPTVLNEDAVSKFAYDMDWFKKISEQAVPLYDASNTNLKPFEEHGGKLLMWHGLADTSQEPANSVAYYEGVQKELGDKVTDTFLRLFLLPGVGHCGGSGFQQIDVLTPLMAWTELHQAPKMLMAGKIATQAVGFGGPGGPRGPGQGAPSQAEAPRQAAAAGPGGPGAGGPGGPGMGGPGGPGRGGMASKPYSSPNQPTLATRPVYPYPYIAQYTGSGDTNDGANFKPVKSPVKLPVEFKAPATTLFAPNNQKFYHVENGQLVVDATK